MNEHLCKPVYIQLGECLSANQNSEKILCLIVTVTSGHCACNLFVPCMIIILLGNENLSFLERCYFVCIYTCMYVNGPTKSILYTEVSLFQAQVSCTTQSKATARVN